METTDREALSQDEIESDLAVDRESGAYFPQRYLTGFFDFLKRHPDKLQVMTYADMPWLDDFDHDANYPKEYAAWNGLLKTGVVDPGKCYVFVQYDVDTRPERTMDLLRHPAHRGVPANVMIFNQRIDRRRLKTSGQLGYTDYELDEALLHDLQNEGFLIGYHCNAFEQGLHDTDRALDVFDADMRALSSRFDVRFFSAHGGVPGPDGRNNKDLPVHQDWARRLRWVHNGRTPAFDFSYSDGGHNSPKRDPAKRDLRDVVSHFAPGRRIRILIHPQYYDHQPKGSARYSGTPWYDAMMSRSSESSSYDPWQNVMLTGFSRSGAARSRMRSATVQKLSRQLGRVRQFLRR